MTFSTNNCFIPKITRGTINRVRVCVKASPAGLHVERMLDFGQFDFGQFDFGQLAEIEVAEIDIGRSRNWPKSTRWCPFYSSFFSFTFFLILLFIFFLFCFALFSLSRHNFHSSLPLLGLLLLNFGGVFEGRDPEMCTFGVLELSCETPAAPPDRAADTTTRELQTCTFHGPALQTPPKFHEKTPPEREERMKFPAGARKKSAKFWAPHPSGPNLVPPFGPPPFGPHPSGHHFF